MVCTNTNTVLCDLPHNLGYNYEPMQKISHHIPLFFFIAAPPNLPCSIVLLRGPHLVAIPPSTQRGNKEPSGLEALFCFSVVFIISSVDVLSCFVSYLRSGT